MKLSCLNSYKNSSIFNYSCRKENKKQNPVSFNLSNLEYKQNSVSPLMFASRVKMNTSRIFEVPEEYFDKEKKLSDFAIECGIDTPFISKNGTYVVQYNNANYNNNPITAEHLKNVFNNLFLLDKNSIFHGDIEKGHVFYSNRNSDVSFDCFRFGCFFDENPDWMRWEFPSNIYPTNIMQFENNCIGDYISQMDDKDEIDSFLKIYLKTASNFHESRADFLAKADASFEQVKYEKTKAIMFKNPDDDIIELLKDRIDFKHKERVAFTKIDEGNGACNHDKNEDLRIDGIIDYFDVMHSALDCLDKVELIKNNLNTSKIKKEFLKGEESYIKHWLEHYFDVAKGNAL